MKQEFLVDSGADFIIFDLEATCWNADRSKQMEIIEIGAVKIVDGEIVDEFQRFVKPILNPILSSFCKQLTSITQNDVGVANTFETVANEFRRWIGDNYFLCSWGFYDKKQLTLDCNLHKLKTDWLENHVSLKHQHAVIKNTRQERGIGLGSALKIEGWQFEGTAHRGIDDAKNIARIFLKYMNDWKYWKA